jgi:hypothetical protein
MTFQLGQVEIQEFSRGFIKEVQINDKWVSGGYGSAIARSNYRSGLVDEIPEPIRSTVDHGYNHENFLGIPAAYNPPEGQVSLIAREINEQYSILAVANKQDEDKGRSEIVGYRYFWLDKKSVINSSHPNMDGVGTLLQWWLSNNTDSLRYVFDMNPSSFRGEKLICDKYLINSEGYDSTISHYPIYPVIFEAKVDALISLHERAVHEAAQLGIPLAWAWNVRKLEFPEMYLAIWYADEAAKKAIELDLERIGIKDEPISTIDPIIWVDQRRDNISLNADEKLVENLLFNFAFDPIPAKAKAVINLIPSNNVGWDKFFAKNNQYIKYLENEDNPPPEAVFYAVWEPILAPQNIVIWLNWLRESQNQKHSRSFLKMHSIIDKSAQKDGKQTEISKLIHEGISVLLYGLISNQIDYKYCKWLLVEQKNSLWSKKFNQYSYSFLDYLNNPQSQVRHESCDDRTHTLWENLNRNYLNQFQPQNPETIKTETKYLAELFQDKFQSQGNAIASLLNQTDQRLLKICCLSALFYQYSEGSIPSSIFVPLENHDKKNINNNDNYQQLIFRLLKQTKPVERMKWVRIIKNIIAILIILGSVGGGLFYSLFSLYSLASINYIQPFLLSPKPSLEDTIIKCRSIESALSSEENKSQQNEEIAECNKQLNELLTGEEEKMKLLKDKSGKYPESRKASIRLTSTYTYLKRSFVNDYLPSPQDNDQYVLVVLQFFKKSVENDVKYDDIFKPLKNCKAKGTRKEFEKCARDFLTK